MRHIITGGSGFTGQVLARKLLSRGQTVINFDIRPYDDIELSKRVKFIKGDIRSLEELKVIGLQPDDVVYHLAARQFAGNVPKRCRQEWFNEVNVDGTANLLATMHAAGADKLIFFSTDMTYGLPLACPVPPTHPQNPLGPYGESKVEAEKLIRKYNSLKATIFRPRLITGPGRLGILGKLFALISKGLPVPMIGNGNNRYQMVSVNDCVDAAILAVDKGCPHGPFNLGSTNPPTTKELLHGIIKHANSRSIVIPIPSAIIKPALSALDKCGLTLLYPEQFGIADKDVLLDTIDTNNTLGWKPSRKDIDAMCDAYNDYIRVK